MRAVRHWTVSGGVAAPPWPWRSDFASTAAVAYGLAKRGPAKAAQAEACRRHGVRRGGWSGRRPRVEANGMFLTSMRLENFLSFGESGAAVEMRPLNLLIGPNGAGKSNFIEALALLQAAPSTSSKSNLPFAISQGGGVGDWIWKGGGAAARALIDATFESPFDDADMDLRYVLGFSGAGGIFEIVEERIEDRDAYDGQDNAHFHYRLHEGMGELNAGDANKPELSVEEVDVTTSILAQRRDPDLHREITHLGRAFAEIGLYREWQLGPRARVRDSQRANLPNRTLEGDSGNLHLVFNRLMNDADAKPRLLKALEDLCDGIRDVAVKIDGGRIQLVFQEGRYAMPAHRLSDGALRFLSLLAILCDPSPSAPLVCLDQPELGLHPDVLPTLADLLMDASERMQLVVATHSETLVDAMTAQPENILVADRAEGGTRLTRLDPEELKVWLKKYSLRDLWERGQIGGVRW